jgi:hypothetical protein
MLPPYSPGTSTSKTPLMQSEVDSVFDIDLEAQLGSKGELIEVEYQFIPRWPMGGPPETVISVLGKTKQVRLPCLSKLGIP